MKNKGFSLIELIVVVAIMGIALTIGGYALSAISLANAKNCATEMNAALELTRSQSYSTDSDTGNIASVSFYYDTDGIYVYKSFENAPKKIGSKHVEVKYTLKDDSTEYILGDKTEQLTFSFDRSSGAFRKVIVGDDTKSQCTSITVKSGGRTYTITCYPTTGKTKLG